MVSEQAFNELYAEYGRLKYENIIMKSTLEKISILNSFSERGSLSGIYSSEALKEITQPIKVELL